MAGVLWHINSAVYIQAWAAGKPIEPTPMMEKLCGLQKEQKAGGEN